MAKPDIQQEVLVLGDHPATYLAAALLRQKSKLRVLHATIPGQNEPDQLTLVNPALFSLHSLLEGCRRKIDLFGIYGLRFLADEEGVGSEYRSKSALSYIASFKAVRATMKELAEKQGVELLTPKKLEILRIDETGLDVELGKSSHHPAALVLGGTLPAHQQKLLGLPDSWESENLHRYTYLNLAGQKWSDLGARPIMPMSLNLRGSLCWGWLLPGPKGFKLAVEQPIETLNQFKSLDLLRHWADVLRHNDLLPQKMEPPFEEAVSVDLPLAGALAHEGVANRTLLIGPAGGFYSACSEDIYPNCWSAIYAADVLQKALKEQHLQDALSPYRQKWRTTLGDYLRGPQQNFRFLLPLVYRNAVMTSRLSESILQGKSVVR